MTTKITIHFYWEEGESKSICTYIPLPLQGFRHSMTIYMTMFLVIGDRYDCCDFLGATIIVDESFIQMIEVLFHHPSLVEKSSSTEFDNVDVNMDA